jgi:DNA-directed RNA polymerase specialized sigma24 family protein
LGKYISLPIYGTVLTVSVGFWLMAPRIVIEKARRLNLMADEVRTTEATDDVELALRMMDGDEQALVTVLRLYAARVENTLRGTFSNVPIGVLEDAVNRAAYTIWKKAGKFDDSRGTLAGLFYKCAVREVQNILREGPKANVVSLDDLDHEPIPHEHGKLTPRKKEQLDALVACIAALPQLQRAICEADSIAGGTADSAYLAKTHHTTIGSIYVSRNKARSTIRSEMTKRGYFT